MTLFAFPPDVAEIDRLSGGNRELLCRWARQKPSTPTFVVLGPRCDVGHDKAAVGLALHTISPRRQNIVVAPRNDADIHEFERHAFLVEETALDRGVRLELHDDRAAGCFCVVVQHLHLADIRLCATKQDAARFVRFHPAHLERCDRTIGHRVKDVSALADRFAGRIDNREWDDSARIENEIARDSFAPGFRVELVQRVHGAETPRHQF